MIGCILSVFWWGYEMGGREGFIYGFSAGSISCDMIDATYAIAILDKIHSNQIDQVISLLETKVDMGIMSYIAYQKTGNPKFDQTHIVNKASRNIEFIVDYRREYPTQSKRSRLVEDISDLLRMFETAQTSNTPAEFR